MTKKSKTLSLCILTFFLICTVLLSIFLLQSRDASNTNKKSDASVVLTAQENSDTVRIEITSVLDYALIFSSDSRQSDSTLASELATLISNATGINLRPKPDTSAAESETEILIGDTNRAVSAELLDMFDSYGSSEMLLVWGYIYKDGKLAYTANCDTAFTVGAIDFLSTVSEDGSITVPYSCAVISTKSVAEYEKEIEEEKKKEEEAKRLETINALIATNSAFTQEQFGGMFRDMPTDEYADPVYYPQEGQHPRLFFTEGDVAAIYDKLLNDPDFEVLRATFWNFANTENFTGIFPERVGASGEVSRYSSTVLAQLEAKALAYVLTEDVVYGYEAIIGAKNTILSLKFTTDLHVDVYHGASKVMVNVAKVFDWCYDLMTEDDKNQIIAGVCNILAPQLEDGMRFPPSGMNGVSGHGTGPQLTRDWITVSLAFYDEVPSWWDFVGGRYFEEYVPVIDYCYQGGWASQGTVTYGDSKYFTKAWAAWLIKNSTGEFPYVENFHLGAYFYFSHIQPNDRYFQTGDGNRSPDGAVITDSCAYLFIAAALFDDPTIGAMAKYYSNDYTVFSYDVTMEMTPSEMLIFTALGPEINEAPKENIDLIQYLPFPSGTMTARNSWDENGTAVLMRMGAMTMANHDLLDHGTFQIYYKGLLAGTSGVYNKYGSNVHKYYLQATVAHNGLLIFNPALADDEPVWSCSNTGADHVHNVTTCAIDNASRYYYSGGQRVRNEAGTIENWLSGAYDMCDIYGVDWSYDLLDDSAEWAYIAGNLTSAYSQDTVKYASRKMLTVFTSNPNYPMLFFTYDQMTSADGGENFTKTFLLHTVNEPEINEDELTAVITAGDGRLFLHSLSGAQTISKIGGEGFAYWINGKNCLDEYSTSDNYNKIWGRMELSATGNLSDAFLTAMYVSDATNGEALEVKYLDSDSVECALIMDKIIAFTKTTSDAQQYKEFSFTTEGTGLYEYYVAGIEAGTWNVKVDGVSVAYTYADEGASILTFTAPTGDVTLIPGNDVIGSSGGRIKYNANGGIVPDSAPIVYDSENPVALPTDIVRGEDIFLGWYTSPNYEEDTLVTHTPKDATGNFAVYAKYLSTFTNVDFTDGSIKLNLLEQDKSNKINFYAGGKSLASFITKGSEDEGMYLEWTEGTQDPIISLTSTEKNYANMTTDDECATFTISLSKDGSNPMMDTHFRIYTKKTVDGSATTTRQYIFTTNSKGEIRLGDSTSGPLVTTLTEERTTISFVMDFKNEEIRAYDEFGNPLATLKVTVKSASGAANMSEWRKLLDEVVFYWYGASAADSGASMRIYGIKIEEGDRIESARSENAISYSYDGGRLPSVTPTSYSKETPTVLPTPTKSGYTFDGWYTTSTFDEGTKITEIPVTTEGTITVYASWLRILDDNEIVYNIYDGELPEGYVTHYTKGEITPLPTPTTSRLHTLFAGWYTSETFEEETRIEAVSAEQSGFITLYAKWVFSAEFDFSEIELDASTKNKDVAINGLYFRPNGAASLKTVTDENGNKYLEFVRGGYNPNIVMTSGDVAKSSSASFSYELVIGKNGDLPMTDFTFRILAKVDVNGNPLSKNNQLYMFFVTDSGAYIYHNPEDYGGVSLTEENRFAEFKDGKLTVRFEIDFENELLIGYGDDGKTVTKPLPIPISSGAKNGIEYMKTFTEYVMYLYSQGDNSVLDESARIYSIKAFSGKVFGQE